MFTKCGDIRALACYVSRWGFYHGDRTEMFEGHLRETESLML